MQVGSAGLHPQLLRVRLAVASAWRREMQHVRRAGMVRRPATMPSMPKPLRSLFHSQSQFVALLRSSSMAFANATR